MSNPYFATTLAETPASTSVHSRQIALTGPPRPCSLLEAHPQNIETQSMGSAASRKPRNSGSRRTLILDCPIYEDRSARGCPWNQSERSKNPSPRAFGRRLDGGFRMPIRLDVWVFMGVFAGVRRPNAKNRCL